MLIKKIVYFGGIIFAVIIINDLAHSIFSLWQKNELLEQREEMLVLERKKNVALKNKLKLVTGPQFIEEEARNKLFLVKPGEGVVMAVPTASAAASGRVVKREEKKANWLLWWEMFF